MNTMNTFVVTPGLDTDSTGAIVYWSLTGGACDYANLVGALAVHGINDPNDLPPLPTPNTAFFRAIKGMETKHRFARFSRQAGVDTYHLIDERERDGDLELTQNVKIQLCAGVVVGHGDDPEGLTGQVGEAYTAALDALTAADVSGYLTSWVKKCDCVALRPTGGFYFIPNNQLSKFRQVAHALREATSFRTFEIPAMPTDDAIEAILDAIGREAVAEAEGIMAELAEGKLGPRALRTRATRCEAMAQKVERYESILGRRMDSLRDQLEDLSAASTAAAMSAEMENSAGA